MNDCKAWPHCRGFSLIELLIAMTVVSILAA
ncbi:MAG: type II secretion system protein, partial [Aeromonas sp.]